MMSLAWCPMIIVILYCCFFLDSVSGEETSTTRIETAASHVLPNTTNKQETPIKRNLDDENHRRLTIFAGPHKTSETSIEEFFYTYANGGKNDDGFETAALKEWLWPQIPPTKLLIENAGIGPHQVFEHLVLDYDNDNIQDELMKYILQEYNQHPTTNIILGSEEFDRVGHTPYSQSNAINAVVRLKEQLQITDHHITIVLLYKTPKIDQWLAMFNFEAIELRPKDRDDAYLEYICNSDSTDKRWETLHTAMNTLYVAKEYRKQGWNVVLVDMAGVSANNKDIEHVIGCDILEVDCTTGGRIQGLESETFQGNSELFDSFGDRTFKSLSDKQEYDLENLFRIRDCNHIDILDDDGIEILYRKNLLMGCDDIIADKSPLMTALQDNDFVLEAVRSQKDCSNQPMNLREVLNGDVIVDGENPYYDHRDSDSGGKYKSSTSSGNSGKSHLSWILPSSIFVLVGVGIWYRREIADRIDKSHQYGGMPFVIEMNNSRNPEPPLSALT